MPRRCAATVLDFEKIILFIWNENLRDNSKAWVIVIFTSGCIVSFMFAAWRLRWELVWVFWVCSSLAALCSLVPQNIKGFWIFSGLLHLIMVLSDVFLTLLIKDSQLPGWCNRHCSVSVTGKEVFVSSWSILNPSFKFAVEIRMLIICLLTWLDSVNTVWSAIRSDVFFCLRFPGWPSLESSGFLFFVSIVDSEFTEARIGVSK